ncbi:hypothetical protein Ahy_B08g090010 isoform C [Arachis hypogaea]|uniref:Uncharacterized protein n=1 Tax=Arachis hypogaea TaxID=3818 RepID=A0A444XZC4_ARAHY|nr:hypothetical protein Ahy_B08g090010 isoform C [Arachis hypogaea]
MEATIPFKLFADLFSSDRGSCRRRWGQDVSVVVACGRSGSSPLRSLSVRAHCPSSSSPSTVSSSPKTVSSSSSAFGLLLSRSPSSSFGFIVSVSPTCRHRCGLSIRLCSCFLPLGHKILFFTGPEQAVALVSLLSREFQRSSITPAPPVAASSIRHCNTPVPFLFVLIYTCCPDPTIEKLEWTRIGIT